MVSLNKLDSDVKFNDTFSRTPLLRTLTIMNSILRSEGVRYNES